MTQSVDERKQMSPVILQQVLLKVVGSRGALDTADLTSLLPKTTNLIEQYQYYVTNIDSEDLTAPETFDLWLRFNPTSLDAELNRLNLPIWGHSRPEILIWLAIDDSGQRSMLGSDSENMEIPLLLEQAADNRGMPLLLPLMDLQDQEQLNFSDIWGDFSEPVLQASQRYGAPVVLTGRMSRVAEDSWNIRWRSFYAGETEQWQSQGDMNSALQAGIYVVTDSLADRFTQLTQNQNEQSITLQVSGVNNFTDYSRVLDYLKKLQSASDVRVTEIDKAQLTVSLNYAGQAEALNELISIGRILEKDFIGTQTEVLGYRLLP